MSPWMITFSVHWIVAATSMWIAAQVVDGIHLSGVGSSLAVAAILGLLNAIVRPILVFAMGPVILLSFGLFLFVINTALLSLSAWTAGKFDAVKFSIDSFGDAFFGALIISIVSLILNALFSMQRRRRRAV